ncbi:excitatory amino acid transporter 1-like [Acropora millepora]|uniref:excitatory amino acid transporter 1-like n=1 Tax=Acropora millepora TaxID=45264 RepID=UPI001CF4C6B0|nr:excitatory amino acid transporter 1-like [Acropora millepora]XP_044170961.1 excitatory amino acid transporter 1-like [Acropora millepora]
MANKFRVAVGRSKCCRSCSGFLLRNLLMVLLALGAAVGFLIGALVNKPVQEIVSPEKRATTEMLIGFPGELLMNMLQVIILPLIVASLITAVSQLDSRSTGRIGRRALIIYLTTTLSAVILGMILVSSIRPGKNEEAKGSAAKPNPYRNLDSFLDLIRSCFPSNLVEATFRQKKTQYRTDPGKYEVYNASDKNPMSLGKNEEIIQTMIYNATINITTVSKEIYPSSNTIPIGVGTNPTGGMNILGLAVFSIVFGIVLGRMGAKAKPLKKIFSALNDAVMILVTLIMWYAPIGICSLIAQRVASMVDIGGELRRLALFIATVLAGLSIHAFIILPLIFFAVRKANPFIFMYGMKDALMTAFGISSSAATLPTTIRCIEENNKVDPRISKFVLPLGATVNMDGTALYEAVAAIFIAQLNNYDLSAGKIIAICVTATAIAIGAAGIPSAGAVTTIVVLQAVSLPLDDIGLILAVDWFMDRFRTTVNVLGDSIVAGVVEHLSRDDLKNHDDCIRSTDEIFPPCNRDEPKEPDEIAITTRM